MGLCWCPQGHSRCRSWPTLLHLQPVLSHEGVGRSGVELLTEVQRPRSTVTACLVAGLTIRLNLVVLGAELEVLVARLERLQGQVGVRVTADHLAHALVAHTGLSCQPCCRHMIDVEATPELHHLLVGEPLLP